MTRLEKARENGMQRKEADQRRCCPDDYNVGPGITNNNLVWPADFGLMGCNGVTCHACWHKEIKDEN